MSKESLKSLFGNKQLRNRIVVCLISLVVVAAAVVGIVSINANQTRKSEFTDTIQNIKVLQSAIYNVGMENQEFSEDLNVLAEQLNDMLNKSLSVVVTGDSITTIETDAWGNQYVIYYSKPNNAYQLEVVSAGPDGQFNTSDDISSSIVCESNANGDSTITITEPDVTNKYETVHVCLFNVKQTSSFTIAKKGTCISPAVYHYSCECGKIGTPTFTTEIDKDNHTDLNTKFELVDMEYHTVTKLCNGCGSVFSTQKSSHNTVDGQCTICQASVHIHDFSVKNMDEKYLKNEASCSMPMQYYYSCACGEADTSTFSVGELLKHDFETIIEEPGCLTEGFSKSTCKVCGAIMGTILESFGHQWVEVETENTLVKPATCCKYALYVQTCAACGIKNDFLFDGSQYDSQNHEGTTRKVYDYSNEEKHVVNVYCNGCNTSIDKFVEEHTLNSAAICSYCNNHVHQFTLKDNLWISEKATCQAPATYYYNCVCGEVGAMTYEYGNIDKSNHTGKVVFAGTINSHTINSCCGTLVSSEHYYTVTENVAATCTAAGHKKLVCECGYYYVEELLMIEHNLVQQTKNELLVSQATCITGDVYYLSCSECNFVSTETFETSNKNANNHSSATTSVYNFVDGNSHVLDVLCVDCMATINSITEAHHFVDGNCNLCNFHAHSFVLTDNVKLRENATCLEKASYYYNCACGAVCDEYYFVGEVNSNNHTGKIEVVGEADVHSRYACCQQIVSTSHEFEEEISKTPTCEDVGVVVYTCSCGYSYKKSIDKIEHNFIKNPNDVSQITPATCVAQAEFLYSCEYCGTTSTIVFVYGELNPNNHIEKETVTYVPSSNYEEHVVTVICDGCTVVKEQYTKPHATDDEGNCIFCQFHMHQYTEQDNVVLRTKATCQSPATYYYNCVCGEAGLEYYTFGEKNASNHPGDIVYLGTSDVCQAYSCCNQSAGISHNYDKETIKAATCNEKGIAKYVCACGFAYEAETDKAAHQFVNQVDSPEFQAIPATCLNQARYYYSCACGEAAEYTYVSGNVDPTNHTGSVINGAQVDACKVYSCCKAVLDVAHVINSEVLIAANCTRNGTTKYYCDCGYYYMETTNKLNHEYTNQSTSYQYVVSLANCTAPAVYYYSCDCGARGSATFTTNELKPDEHIGYIINANDRNVCKKYSCCGKALNLEHNFSCVVASVPSCLNTGIAQNKCLACGFTYEDVIERSEHDFSIKLPADSALVSVANCVSPAKYYHSCAVCMKAGGELFEYGQVNTKEHNSTYNKYNVIDASTHGVTTVCEGCGTIVSSQVEPHTMSTDNKCMYCQEHVHVFDRAIANDTFIKNKATCKDLAVYYYSCHCGEKGNATFELPGSTLAHSYICATPSSMYLIKKATCIEKAVYIKSCLYCGKADSDFNNTFTYGEFDNTKHIGEPTYKYSIINDTTHEKTEHCSACMNIINTISEEHTIGSNASCLHCGHKPHNHVYMNKSILPKHLASPATCLLPALYYYSCACGQSGTDTFVYGETVEHVEMYVGTIDCHSKCRNCDTVLERYHRFAESIVANPTCETNGVKMLSCQCGYKERVTLYATGHVKTSIRYEELNNKFHSKIVLCQTCNTIVSAEDNVHDSNTKCSLCGYIRPLSPGIGGDGPAFNEYPIAQIDPTDPVCEALQLVYGKNTTAKYSYSYTAACKYLMSVNVGGTIINVYVSEKPPILNNEKAIGLGDPNDPIVAALQAAYGRNSTVKYSYVATLNCKYATTIQVNGKSVTVYVSEKPHVTNDEKTIGLGDPNDPLVAALQAAYGSNSTVKYSYVATENCKYATAIQVNGQSVTIYVSEKPKP